MTWKFNRITNMVRNVETLAHLMVTGNNYNNFQIEIRCAPILGWSEQEMYEALDEVSSLVRRELMSIRMLELIDSCCGTSYKNAANIIERISGKQVSERSIQAWITEAEKISSRKCPLWALNALESYAAMKTSERESLQYINHNPRACFEAVDDSTLVRLAGDRIEADILSQEKWKGGGGSDLPEQLLTLENRVDELNRLVLKIKTAVVEVKSFDEMKASFQALFSEYHGVD